MTSNAFHLDCVESFTLRVCQGSHVKEESPRIFSITRTNGRAFQFHVGTPSTKARQCEGEKKAAKVDNSFEADQDG